MVDENNAIKVRIDSETAVPAPEGVNFFYFTRIADEYQLLVGNVNLMRLHEMTTGEAPFEFEPQITHRFLMSQFGFDRLKAALDDISAKTDASRARRQKEAKE